MYRHIHIEYKIIFFCLSAIEDKVRIDEFVGFASIADIDMRTCVNVKKYICRVRFKHGDALQMHPVSIDYCRAVEESSTNISEHKYFLYQHFEIEIFFNKDQIIEAHLDMDIELQYSVHWIETNAHFHERMKKYLVPHNSSIHHFSTRVMFLILFGCLLIYYMRFIWKDFYDFIPEDTAVDREQTGWKCICSDVFQYPNNGSLFAAALGSGAQLCILATFTLLLGLLGVFYPFNRGNLFMAWIVLNTMTSGFAGNLAVLFYCQIEGKNWVCLYFLCRLFLIFCFLNTVAASYQANASHGEFQATCETSKCPREVPSLRCYRGTFPQMVLAGFLPFSTIYMQLHYMLMSIWGNRVYTLYSTIFVIFIILLITISLITVALTHFQLAAEDHQWWWSIFFYQCFLMVSHPSFIKTRCRATRKLNTKRTLTPFQRGGDARI
ncbi:hypothetical protein ACJRO7_010314 [Eucalyptus globulus]|uniref:Transmembrane 9 superfamily member n=1 Tax=Eucalyptus globulus TaxID=34317 RepID=A0ABD3LF35_EUCGL